MGQSRKRSDDIDDSGEIADVSQFLGDDDDRPAPPSTRPVVGSSDLEGYDLVDEPEATAPAPPIPPVPPTLGDETPKRRRPRDEADDTPRAAEADVKGARIEQEWSRGAEWGSTLVVVGIAALGTLALLYFTFDIDHLGRSFVLLVLGAAITLALSYPILITLERPVRVTPEQALQDFYDALSHWMPHHRRMWLLLSESGRSAPAYHDFAGFRRYWKGVVADLKAKAGGSAPLEIRIADYKADKSAGKDALRARFTVQVFRAGAADAGPVASYRDSMNLTRGPDRMWYLDRGTFPDAG